MYETAKSWPFHEARSLLQHITRKGKKPGDLVTFETGYGPSGAPHIGTFGEVIRTLWVMRAFNELTSHAYKTRLIMFSDDYDAMRKRPDDLPEWMDEYLGFRLSSIPNPYEDAKGANFAQANNLKLTFFVDDVLAAFDSTKLKFIEKDDQTGEAPGVYFCSSAYFYRSGRFNDQLLNVYRNHDAILDILLPTFGEERRATYCAFMPLSGPDGQLDRYVKGHVELVPSYGEGYVCNREKGFPSFSPVTDGMTKLQWKVDWAMRWVHFDVDYEMSGKDLIDSVRLSSQICKVLGGTPPLNMTYELFLDENGEKISKTKGNGFTIKQWLTYGNFASLCLFMFQNPRAAKKLYMGLIPGLEDELLKASRKAELSCDDPLWHIKGPKDHIPFETEVTYQLILNLAKVTQAQTSESLLAYFEQHRQINARDRIYVEALIERVLRYANDKGLMTRNLRAPTDHERAAFQALASRLELLMSPMGAEAFQYQVYEIGKEFGFNPLRSWFQSLYECFFGASEGPRFGAFTEAYGLKNTIQMLRSV